MFEFAQMPAGPLKLLNQASQVTDVAWASINGLIMGAIERLPYVLAGLLVLGVFYTASRLSKGIFWLATKKTHLDPRLRILFSRLIALFLTILGIFTALSIIVPSFSFGNIIAGFGLTSVVIGFATKDIINNLLSGVMILWHRPFQIGDYLYFGTHQGKVEYIGVRATSLRKDDGELILIPNGEMYSSALTIRGAGALRRMNLKFSVGYDADITYVKEITGNTLAALDFIENEPPARVFVTDLNSEGVNITVNFWINTDRSRPREAFDTAAVEIMKHLDDGKVQLFPPGSIIVQRHVDTGGNNGAEAETSSLPSES